MIVHPFQTSPQREAADTRSPSGEDALEALTESTPLVHPEVCSGCNQTIKTHVTCVGHAVATCDWECRSRSACCPRRDVVRGWQYWDGLCFWWYQDLKRLANMGGERGAMWMMNAHDEDVCGFDSGLLVLPTRHRFGPNTPCCKQYGGNRRTEHEELRDRPRVRVTATGVGSALPDVSFIFAIVLNCCVCSFRRTPSRSSAPCQTLTTQTMRSWKAVAEAYGEHSKRTQGATCFEHVYVIVSVLFSAHPDIPRKRRIVELELWKAPGLAFHFLSKLVRSISVTIDHFPCHQRH